MELNPEDSEGKDEVSDGGVILVTLEKNRMLVKGLGFIHKDMFSVCIRFKDKRRMLLPASLM